MADIEVQNFRIEADAVTQYSGNPGAGVKAVGNIVSMDSSGSLLTEGSLRDKLRFLIEKDTFAGDVPKKRLQVKEYGAWYDIHETTDEFEIDNDYSKGQ